MEEVKTTYNKKDIAKEQLRTAIVIFLKGLSYPSVITLAGASGSILHQLVLNRGKTPFVDFARDVKVKLTGENIKRQKYKSFLNNHLGINHLKHMSNECSETVEIDLEESAYRALVVAVNDYIVLNGQDDDFIKAFLKWSWVNKDGPDAMKEYEKFAKDLKK